MKSSAYPPLLQTTPHIWTTNPFLQENIDPPFYDISKIPNPYKEGGKRGEKGGGFTLQSFQVKLPFPDGVWPKHINPTVCKSWYFKTFNFR